MANTLITPSVIAREALRTLYAQTLFAQLVYRDYDSAFDGRVGDTITVRKPATFTANTFSRAAGITLQDTTESSLTVTLDTLLDVSFAVTAEELALRIFDFSEQFIYPATMAIAEKVDQLLYALATGAGVTNTKQMNSGAGAAIDPKKFAEVNQLFNNANVPLNPRIAVLSNQMAADLQANDLFIQAQQRGDTAGLVDSNIGRKFGFDIYQSTNAGVLATSKGVAFHPSGLALVSRTLGAPAGLPPGAVAVAAIDGFGIRVTQAYDVTKKQDIISLDTLIGTKVIDAARVCQLTRA